MNNSQVGHIFAQGNGATANGSNFKCYDNKLYSYYTVIAAWHTTPGGVPVCFISSNTMSSTTGKHLSKIRSYTITGRTFYTPAFRYGDHYGPNPREAIQAAAAQNAEYFPALCRKRTNLNYCLNSYDARRADILELAALFELDSGTLADMPEITDELRQRARDMATREETRRAEKDRIAYAREARQRELDAADYELWLLTGAGTCPGSYRQRGNDQITIRGDEVITSQGAAAPLEHVRAALAFYNLHQWPYQRNGHTVHLGHYTLDSIDEAGNVRAGCHTFTAAEIERFTTQHARTLKGGTP